MAARTAPTKTGGREATTGFIPGDFALSVGMPETQAPRGWKWTALTAVARLETGHTPSRDHPEYWNGDIPWVGIKDATGNHGLTIDDTLQHTTQAGIDNSSARVLPAHTVCLSRTASVGYVIVMGRPMATSQDFVNWVCSDALDYRYLKYVLLSERRSFLRFASGTTHQTIYFPEVKAFHVCLPPLPEQRAIAAVLGVLDDKIEVNRKMARVLEGIARAVFTSWFVDFDPVRRAAAGQPTGLPADLSALFPKRMVDTAIGEVPEGWRVGSLGDMLEVLETGGRPKGGVKDITDGVPSVGAESIKRLGEFDYSKTKYVPREFFDSMTRGHVQPGDVLLYKDGGRPGEFEPHVTMVGDGFPFPKFCINEHVYRIRVREPMSQAYLYFWLTSERVMEEMRQRGTGVAIPGLNSTAARAITLLIPAETVLRRFNAAVAPAVDRVLCACNQSRTLAALRDALLPKLISGELRIAEAEKIVGRAV